MTEIIEEVGTEEVEEFDEIEEPKGIPIDEFGIVLESHEGFFNPNQVKFLCYGESGAGKTVFASTWPRAVFLDIDKGMASIRKKVHRIPVDGWHDLQQGVDFLTRAEHPFRTVIVDSLNELQSLAMRNIVTTFPQIRRAYTDLPSQSDYGKMLDEFDKMVRKLKALSLNVVFICNVAPQEFETDVVQPQLVGRHSPRNLARMMDVIGYIYKVEGGSENPEGGKTRRMVFDATQYVTKDRSGVLPPTLDHPAYAMLYEYWRERSKPSK